MKTDYPENIPRATFRFQFNEHFRLRDALALVPYLHDLGISHIYSSPLCRARPHSLHGYDTCDFKQLNPEIGTEADMGELVQTLRRHDMGLVLDIVPNHMGVECAENRWWWDVLTHGETSQFAKYFDIDWNASDPRLRGKVLLPVLADRYSKLLLRREFRVEAMQDNLVLRYGENIFPINPASRHSIIGSLASLNSHLEALDALLEQQHYRLASSRHHDSEVNYRRFFNVNSLAALQVENQDVFDEVHSLVHQWQQHGWLDGLRVDHPDGLSDPEQFFNRLEKLAPHAWIVAEKILEPGENLRSTWAISGTTGYDFLNRVAGLFIDPAGRESLTIFYAELTGHTDDYEKLVREKKVLALHCLLNAEVERLTGLLVAVATRHWRYRDFTRAELREALCELAASFSTYRTYVRPQNLQLTSDDGVQIARAADEAMTARPDLPHELFEFLTRLLLLTMKGDLEGEFVVRFQQLTGPTMAKGVEDTAFYCFNRLVALNEVGGNPGKFGCEPEEFHQFCKSQQEHWPFSMLTTSTHDTKRSEDVRMRLSLLSEIPDEWLKVVRGWCAHNEKYRRNGQPDRNAEYLFYQTLVGAWPISVERMMDFMEKGVHEARENTDWTRANANFDSAVRDFVIATLRDADFLKELETFVEPLKKPACINSIAQLLLKLTAPGVPDIYQGNELWDLSLVDPDNRRRVDFSVRQRLLAEAKACSAEQAWQQWESGMPKLWLLQRVLNLRKQRPDLFSATAKYRPMTATGKWHGRVVAFQRGSHLISVAPRLLIGIKGDWSDTRLTLPPGNWRNALTGENLDPPEISIGDLLRLFPVALLTQEER